MQSGLKIKNTFLELEADAVACPKRSSSLPAELRCLSRKVEDEAASSEGGPSTADLESLDALEACSVCTLSSADNSSEISPSDSVSNRGGSEDAGLEDSYVPRAAIGYLMPRTLLQPCLLGNVQETFKAIALAAFSTLAAFGEPVLSKSFYGYQVVLKVRQQQLSDKVLWLNQAKAAVLAAAENSAATFVLGYLGQPFMNSPLGFSALLGHVVDESKACWQMLQWGCCKHGAHCRWAHPEVTATLNVMVAP